MFTPDSFLAVLFLALWHIFCGRQPLIHSVRHSNWLSFSGGIAIAYVFEGLLPKLGEWQGMLSGQSDLKSVVPKLFEDLGMAEYYGGIPKLITYEIFLLALTEVVSH